MNEPLTIRVFGRRRNILINSPYQHRLSLFTTLLAMLPPTIFFGIYFLIMEEGSQRIVDNSPGLQEIVRNQDRMENLLILAALLFYGIGVYLVSLLESHRTAGFMHRLNGNLKQLRDGRYGATFMPRREDNFAHMADSLNGLSRVLQVRTEEDLALLGEIGSAVDDVLAGAGPIDVRSRERLADLRRRIEALRSLKKSHLPDDSEAALTPADVPVVSDGGTDAPTLNDSQPPPAVR